MLLESEKKLLSEIQGWEQNLYRYETNDLENALEKYLEKAFSFLPEKVQHDFFATLDNGLLHLHSLIQGGDLHDDTRRRIIKAGTVFDGTIEHIADLRKLNLNQLQYIADQQISRHRLYAFAQGGLSGTGSAWILASDLPIIAFINLRAIHFIAMSYGFEINNPYEMMISLKVFHGATLPKRFRGVSWDELMADLREEKERYFYDGKEEVLTLSWLEQPLKQLLKAMAILFFRNKKIEGIPLISMAIGASMNYQLTKNVTDFAQKYYQMRYLMEKEQQI